MKYLAMNNKRHSIQLLNAIPSPLSGIPFHNSIIGVKRYVYKGKEVNDTTPLHIAIHQITSSFKTGKNGVFRYTTPHGHDCWEIGIFFPLTRNFVVQIRANKKLYVIRSHKAVVIPKGIIHQIEAVRGEGLLFCILGTSNYVNSLLSKAKSQKSKKCC